jgi:hypothetical protein
MMFGVKWLEIINKNSMSKQNKTIDITNQHYSKMNEILG